jgi:hypothetical protein
MFVLFLNEARQLLRSFFGADIGLHNIKAFGS